MRLALKRHPDSQCEAARRVEAEVVRRAGNLLLHYFVTGKMNDLLLPAATASGRADELWRHTCFEAFVRPLPGFAYCEFNFAPSTQWAAYQFSGYRSGMRIADEMGPPRIDGRWNGACYELQVTLTLDRLPALPAEAAWQLALSAVIEERSGRKSYWALAHPPGIPDFHQQDCFALEVPPA